MVPRIVAGRLADHLGQVAVGDQPAQRRPQGVHVGADDARLGGTTSGAMVDATATTGMPRNMASSSDKPSDVQRAVCR